MRFIAAAVWVVVLAAAQGCVGQEKPANEEYALNSENSLVGQVLLPPGKGSRGVEVVAAIAESENEPWDNWILFDNQGRFSHTFSGNLTSITISTGLRAELHRIDAEDLPAVNQAGQYDVGVIDLRDRLIKYRMVIREAKGATSSEVRVAMFFGPPHVGPNGEPVSLGSRQFPPVEIGSDIDWLLPHKAQDIYFLVERPLASGNGWEWRGGYQKLFGPFTMANLPTELLMD